jgi:hypothetical protein
MAGLGEPVLKPSLLREAGFQWLLKMVTIVGIRVWMPETEGRVGKRSYRSW